MEYKSFLEYVQDVCFKRLHPGGKYGDRRVLKLSRESVTHIGRITIEGSLSPAALCQDHVVHHRLKSNLMENFDGMIYRTDRVFLRILSKGTQGDPAKWILEVETSELWRYRHYRQWYLKKLPFTIDEIDVQFIITKIDFNVKMTFKTEMSAYTVGRQWYHFEKPEHWLTDIGGRHLNVKDNRKVRVGLKKRSYDSWGCYDDLWDIPDERYVPACLSYNIKGGWAFCLPFVSVYNSNPQNNTAMKFSGDDFLPNPQRRRDLFNLVKKSDSGVLDAHFNEQEVYKKTWGESTSTRHLSWKKMGSVDRRWLKVKSITAHQPNSILGSILLDGDRHLIKFTMKYFEITAAELNQLQVGRYCAAEHLARIGRLSFVSGLVNGQLKLTGKVFFSRKLSFQRVWSVVFAALDVDSVEYLRAAIALDKKGKLLNLRAHRGVTALGIAVLRNKVEHVRVLVEARADVNQSSWGDESVLCLGLQFGVSLEIIKELVQAGAKVTGNDLAGNSIASQLEALGLRG